MKNRAESVAPETCVKSADRPIDPSKVYRAITDAVFAIDEHGVFQFASPSCMHLFGYAPEEMNGASFLKFIHPQDVCRTAQVLAAPNPVAAFRTSKTTFTAKTAFPFP